MTHAPGSKALTESILSIIRPQRHSGAWVIVSSQESTISLRITDLCSTTAPNGSVSLVDISQRARSTRTLMDSSSES